LLYVLFVSALPAHLGRANVWCADARQTLLGTQFIKLGHDENGQVTIIMAGEMVIFVVLTVIMLALTFGCWVAWEKWDKIKTTLRGGLNGLRREKNSSVV